MPLENSKLSYAAVFCHGMAMYILGPIAPQLFNKIQQPIILFVVWVWARGMASTFVGCFYKKVLGKLTMQRKLWVLLLILGVSLILIVVLENFIGLTTVAFVMSLSLFAI